MTPEEAKAEFIRRGKQVGKVEFYGRMYGRVEDKILNMCVNSKPPLGINFNKIGDYEYFSYIWGWPGPDYNNYFFRDYGKTWAFTMSDFKE